MKQPPRGLILSRALLELIQASLDRRTTNHRDLAAQLCKSSETVRTEFAQIREKLGAKTLFEAILIAVQKGWVKPPPPAG